MQIDRLLRSQKSLVPESSFFRPPSAGLAHHRLIHAHPFGRVGGSRSLAEESDALVDEEDGVEAC